MTEQEINTMKYKVCCPWCDNKKCVRGTDKCEAEIWAKKKGKERQGMKCPFQTRIVHKPEYTEGYVKHFAEDFTEFCDCYGNECPYYYTKQTYDGVDEHCYRAERSEE